MVPPNWEHPKNASRVYYIPLHDGYVKAALAWEEGKVQWEKGFRLNCQGDAFIRKNAQHEEYSWEEWHGERPQKEDYMPDFPAEQRTHLQMYEDTSEGTPISPVCETAEELASWLADNHASAFGNRTASYDDWIATIKNGSAVSMVISSAGIQSGVEAAEK
jgi:hypothetical protein